MKNITIIKKMMHQCNYKHEDVYQLNLLSYYKVGLGDLEVFLCKFSEILEDKDFKQVSKRQII